MRFGGAVQDLSRGHGHGALWADLLIRGGLPCLLPARALPAPHGKAFTMSVHLHKRQCMSGGTLGCLSTAAKALTCDVLTRLLRGPVAGAPGQRHASRQAQARCFRVSTS